ncbi:hypothetical protein [Pedobacter panaciterrae]
MVKDTLNSVFDNLKERTTNPFLGTLIVVWVLKNWKLVYSLFYFDSNFKLEDRLCFISQYFQDKSFTYNLFIVVLLTILVLLFTYCMLSLSRLITDAYDKIVLPFLSKLTDKSSIVLKSEHLALKEVVKQLEVRLEEERLAKGTAQKERDESDAKLAEILSKKPNSEHALESEVTNTIPQSFIRVSNKAKQLWTPTKFNGYLANITGGALMTNGDDIMKVLLRENFIVPGGRSTSDGKDYKLTDEGLAFLKYWNDLPEDEVSE